MAITGLFLISFEPNNNTTILIQHHSSDTYTYDAGIWTHNLSIRSLLTLPLHHHGNYLSTLRGRNGDRHHKQPCVLESANDLV